MFKTIEELITTLEKYDKKKLQFDSFKYVPALNSIEFDHHEGLSEAEKDINEIYLTLKNRQLEFRPTVLTPAGNIKRFIRNYYRTWFHEVIKSSTGLFKGIKFTIIICNRVYRLSFGYKGTKNSAMTGFEAYRLFQKTCKKYKINLNNYKQTKEEGLKSKSEIKGYSILRNWQISRKVYHHVNHLDIHSAWPAGVINTYPEFKPVFDDLYKIDKQTGPKALGYFQSKKCNYAYANLAKLGINWCDKKIWNIILKLQLDGFTVIQVNTDGVWYCKENSDVNVIYHDEDEGKEIGQWKTDHVDCDFYSHSDGAYWYVENGKFVPVARGRYSYENIKSRDQWDEDDFMKAMTTMITYDWDEEKGLKIIEWR